MGSAKEGDHKGRPYEIDIVYGRPWCGALFEPQPLFLFEPAARMSASDMRDNRENSGPALAGGPMRPLPIQLSSSAKAGDPVRRSLSVYHCRLWNTGSPGQAGR